MSLDNLRQQINDIDDQIVRLLNERAALSLQVGQRKADAGSARFFAPERERDVINRIRELQPEGALPKEALTAIYREIMSASIALQKPITVAFWGPPGSFTEQAARQRFGSSAQFHDSANIPDVFGQVERGIVDFGVVPVENSTAGVVNYTLDMFHDTTLRICAEIYVTIVQNLLTHATALDQIKRVYTGPQPLEQCRRWLEAHLPNVEFVDIAPTSKAAERAARDPEGAAIVPRRASEVTGVPLLFEHIEDNANNRTRFLVIGRNEPPPTGRDKTSVLFAVKNQPGSLGRALRAFEKFNVNLSMIASRPTKNSAWEYVQFADFQGHEADEPVQNALNELREHAIYVTVLGSYPEG